MTSLPEDPEAVLEVMRRRHCIRRFRPEPVPRALLAGILTAAANAPSSKNTQPWGVEVLLDGQAQTLSQRLCALFDAGVPQQSDYRYTQMPPEFMERARACGYGLFALKGIERHDREARKAHDRENFELFGAPALLIFHLPAWAEPGNFLDLGFLMQNVMLGLVAHGLGACPQYSLAGYPDAIREALGLSERLIVAGMSLGWPEPEALVNTYVPERLPLAAWVNWHTD